MKRTLLFLATNLAMLATLGLITALLSALLGQDLAALVGRDWAFLAIFAFVYGFLGACISLLLSKTIAKMSCGARTIDGSEGPAERWLVDTVASLAASAGVKTPEVAVYKGSANAFATGAFRNAALVAVSTDIMRQMTREELRAVLGHEMSHVANGDMVTMTMIQGVLNAFVLFISRAAAGALAAALSGRNRDRRGGMDYGAYRAIAMFLDMALGLLASLVVLAYSRRREYAADAGSARLLGSPRPMIDALKRLGSLQPGVLPGSLRAMGIAGRRESASVWSSHPSLGDRIRALENMVCPAA